MKTIIVDDEVLAIERFEHECDGLSEVEIVGKFTNPEEALKFAEKNYVEFAVLDVEMAAVNGIELGMHLRKRYPSMVMVYITGYSQYVVDTLKIKADYCVLKPYSHEDIIDLVERARLLLQRQRKRIRAQMLGRFNLFVDDQVLPISNAKAKELLALCLDHRGGIVTMEEAIDKLWPNREYDVRVKRLYRKAIASLHAVLRGVQCDQFLETGRGYCNIRPELVDCDYYQFLDHPKENRELFHEEYLFDYDWGEETLAKLFTLS